MKLIILFITIVPLSWTSCSQDIPASKVPSIVQNSLQTRFATAVKIEWEKKNDVYEAEFYIDSTEYTVHIDPTGKVIKYKLDIKESELPASVIAAIRQEYAGYQVDDAERLEKDGSTYFQVELEAKGKKDRELVFNADGKPALSISYMK